jgi:hypothetical protein
MKALLAASVFCATLAGAEAPPSATTLVDEARAKAAPGNQAVLLIFHASWCGWCKKLDTFLESPEIRAIVQRYFVPVHVTVKERGDKQSLNSPGGEALMKQVGADGGLPFFAFLDVGGRVIVNSIAPSTDGKNGGNIGHPYEPQEVDWFLAIVQKAARGITAEERGAMEKYLRAQKK